MPILRRRLLQGTAGAIGLAASLGGTSQAAEPGKTLVLAMPQTPEGFDGDVLRPGTQGTVVQAYEGLVRYGRVERDGRTYLDPTKLEPHLAEKWETSSDGKRWVITLPPGREEPVWQ